MLKLDPRSRPSADMLLKMPEVASMLQLDETSTSFGQAAHSDNPQPLSLISTIKVPQQLRRLNNALPKPCYPDVRPNSPTSWTVAEQKAQREADQQQAQLRAAQRKPAPLPPVPTLPLPSMYDENTPPLPTPVGGSNKENLYPIPTHRSDGGSGKPAKHVGFVPAPPPPAASGVPPAVVAEHYARRPLAPAYPSHPSNRANVAPHRPGAAPETTDSSAPYKVPGYHRPVAYKPSLDAVAQGGDRENQHAPAPPVSARSEASIPSVAYERHQGYQHHARAPPRLQYHHNRVW